jgi:hypothetical protein
LITASDTAPKAHSNGKDATWEVIKLIQPSLDWHWSAAIGALSPLVVSPTL